MQYRIKKVTYNNESYYLIEYKVPYFLYIEYWDLLTNKQFKTEQEARKRIKDIQDFYRNKREEIINL